jgi:competence protein ComEC
LHATITKLRRITGIWWLALWLVACLPAAGGPLAETRLPPTVAPAPTQTVPAPVATPQPTLAPTLAPTLGAHELGTRQEGRLKVYYWDVDQGDSTLLQGPDFTILIDAGRHDRNDVTPYLEAVGVQALDLLIGTHPHADHIGQFPQILARFPVTEVWMSGDTHTSLTFERALDAILSSGAGYHEPVAGEVYQIGLARIEVLNPEELSGHFHEGSISVRIRFGEVNFLFTGDAEGPIERAMIDRGRPVQAQILQLGHHGSRTSSSRLFLEAVQPEVAIWSAGRENLFGHPHPEVISRLDELGIEVYGTATHATILVESDGQSYALFTAQLLRAGCRAGQVNINSAPASELQRIVHVGPEYASQILRLRPFASVDDLARIRGIAAGRLADIRAQDLACVD